MGRTNGRYGAAARRLMIVIAVALVPVPASAFDLTGRWVGRISCSGLLEGQPRRIQNAPSTMLVNDRDGLRITVDGIGYNGEEIPSPTRPTRGEAAVIRCGSSPTLSGGEFGGEFGRMKVSTAPEKGTGSFRGTSIRTDIVLASTVYTCRWSYKRVTTEVPPLESCP